MKHVIRLLIALLIGGIAAVLNYMWMSQERDYPEFVYVAEPLAAGEKITKEILKPVPVKGDVKLLNKILVPWTQKELWYDRYAAVDYSSDQPLLQRDMINSASTGQWDTLGPFTLVGVGNEATAAFSGEQGNLIPVSGNTLTLAVDDSQDEEKSLLYRYLAAMRGEYYFNETASERNMLKIIGVEPRVSRNRSTASDAPQPDRGPVLTGNNANKNSPDFAGKRLIFVSLEHIPNAPSWLRIGEEIYFMVPPGKQTLLKTK